MNFITVNAYYKKMLPWLYVVSRLITVIILINIMSILPPSTPIMCTYVTMYFMQYVAKYQVRQIHITHDITAHSSNNSDANNIQTELYGELSLVHQLLLI